MEWKHFRMMHKSSVTGICNQDILPCLIEIGRVETGKNRVQMGSYCRIECGGYQICSEETTLFQSVIKASGQLEEIGIEINIYAFQKGFYESGMSANTGWGYSVNIHHPILMIDQVEK